MKQPIKKIRDRFESKSLVVRAALLVFVSLFLAGVYYLVLIVPLQREIFKIDEAIDKISAENRQLRIENNAEVKQFDRLKKELLSTRDARKALKEALKLDSNLRFIDMYGEGIKASEKSGIGTNTIAIRFVGSYFSVLNYLKTLEQMPIEIYWEYFNYHVTNYPEAEVVLRIHTVDNE